MREFYALGDAAGALAIGRLLAPPSASDSRPHAPDSEEIVLTEDDFDDEWALDAG
jgi:hypothetical protein